MAAKKIISFEAVDASNLQLCPDPFVPADLDLRRLWWMKLDIGSYQARKVQTRRIIILCS